MVYSGRSIESLSTPVLCTCWSQLLEYEVENLINGGFGPCLLNLHVQDILQAAVVEKLSCMTEAVYMNY